MGGAESIPVDIRVIAACNIGLDKLVEEGIFRSDLYYRLNVIRIAAPPLRDHKEDIPLLIHDFIKRLNRQLGMIVRDISSEALNFLMTYDWPGNVRELHNSVECAMNMNQNDGAILTIKDFSQLKERIRMREQKKDCRAHGNFDLITARNSFEKGLVQDALAYSDGNRKKAAELLGISRTMLYNKMKQFQIS